MRERYLLKQGFSLPAFFLDCKYDEDNKEEEAAFNASLENMLISAKLKTPYNPKDATAALPMNVRLAEEKKILAKKATENEERANKEAYLREKERLEGELKVKNCIKENQVKLQEFELLMKLKIEEF